MGGTWLIQFALAHIRRFDGQLASHTLLSEQSKVFFTGHPNHSNYSIEKWWGPKLTMTLSAPRQEHWEDENQDCPVRDTCCLSSRCGRDARTTRFPLEFLSVSCIWLYRQRVSHYREMSLSQRISEHLVNSESCQWPHLAGFQKQSIWEHNLATWSLQIVNWGQLADHS